MDASHVVGLLAETLEADTQRRSRAEVAINGLEGYEGESSTLWSCREGSVKQHIYLTSGFALLLGGIIGHPDHSASVVLRQTIERHWYRGADKFVDPEIHDHEKEAVRVLVVKHLSDDHPKIRLVCAQVASKIASFDWPENWPTLLPTLVQNLRSGNANATHGSIGVVNELVAHELGEEQAVPVVNDLLPALLDVLNNSQTHSTRIRAIAVTSFRHVVGMLNSIKLESPELVKKALEFVLPPWTRAFQTVLSQDAAAAVAADWDEVALRIEIFTCLMNIWGWFPKTVSKSAALHVQMALSTLTSLATVFHSYYIDSSDGAPDPPDEDERTSYGPAQTHIDQLACAIFEMLEPVARSEQAVQLGKDPIVLDTMVSMIITYTQVSRNNEEEWLEDVNAFVEDDDLENGMLVSPRIVGIDLVDSLVEKWGSPVVQALGARTRQCVERSATAREQGSKDWWKPLEAALRIVGAIANDLLPMLEQDRQAGRPLSFDLSTYFSQVVPNLLQQADTPFLQGRAFIFASNFAESLDATLAGQYLGATVQTLSSDAPVTVKICAVKTIQNFCRVANTDMMRPRFEEILRVLFDVVPHATEDTLILLLDTILGVVSVSKDALTCEQAVSIAERMYAEWERQTMVTDIAEEVVSVLITCDPAIAAAVVDRLVPQLAATIVAQNSGDVVHVAEVSMQFATALVRPRAGPLEARFVEAIVPATIRRLMVTDDADEVQNGMQLLTQVVRKDCDKLIQLHDEHFGSGLDGILGIVSRVLNPASSFSDNAGVHVGELVMHLFRKAGPVIASILPDMLAALAQRLARAEYNFFRESLVMPFAYLCGTGYANDVLQLLANINVSVRSEAGDKSVSALNVVLTAWSGAAETLSGSWNLRVNDIGLSKLFMLPRGTIDSVLVQGDMILDNVNANTIMTRSKAKKGKCTTLLTPTATADVAAPTRYTQIPFPVKALKLLLKDVAAMGKPDGSSKKSADELGVVDDDGDDEWDDDDPLASAETDEFGLLSDWLDAGREDGTDEDDEDLKADPLAQHDLGQYLTATLREAYASNVNGIHEMVDALTDGEKKILKGVLTL